jgi:hypothetical protein
MSTGSATSTGDVLTAAKINLKLETVSTGDILTGTEISTPYLVSPTISSGMTLDGQVSRTATTAITLGIGDIGKIIYCAVDGTFITLPYLNSTTIIGGGSYTIKNTGTTGAVQVILITATGQAIIGADISTTNLISNTKVTADKGDYVSVVATASTTWYISGLVGTWASTT